MVNNIIDGISIKLNQVFGDSYEIYSEEVIQGLNEPCFFISSLSSTRSQLLGNRSFREHPFDIHYFPSTDNKNFEMNSIVDQLESDLEYINVGSDLVRGTKMSSEIVDGVLHFFVNYDMFVVKEIIPIDSMEGITIDGGLKG